MRNWPWERERHVGEWDGSEKKYGMRIEGTCIDRNENMNWLSYLELTLAIIHLRVFLIQIHNHSRAQKCLVVVFDDK